MILKLAFKNIIGAGLRTWLNVFVLASAFVLIVWSKGFYTGMMNMAENAKIEEEAAGGHYVHKSYDEYDPFTYEESHSTIPKKLMEEIDKGNAVPVLVNQGVIYPNQRMKSITLKGIKSGQKILDLPTQLLKSDDPDIIPVMIGKRTAQKIKAKQGDFIVLRWRDVHGSFDAADVKIVKIMNTRTQSVDNNNVWISWEQLEKMIETKNHATYIAVKEDSDLKNLEFKNFIFKPQSELLKDLLIIRKKEKAQNFIFYGIMMFLAVIAVFDTQFLAVFRRRKEMGTLMALGMTRLQVMLLFTLEGVLYGVLAVIAGSLIAAPLMYYSSAYGISMGVDYDNFGIPGMSETLSAEYTAGSIIFTLIILLLIVSVVSFLPTKRISKLKPTDALRGKWSK